MKKKPSIAIVLGMGKPRPSDEEDEGESGGEMDYSEEQHAMADELIQAIAEKDAQKVLDAFHGIYRSYRMDEEGAENEELGEEKGKY